jgi:hypothetical protein
MNRITLRAFPSLSLSFTAVRPKHEKAVKDAGQGHDACGGMRSQRAHERRRSPTEALWYNRLSDGGSRLRRAVAEIRRLYHIW